MGELSKKWNGLTDAQKQNISYAIAATRQTNTLNALMKNYSSSMDLATEATNTNGNAMANQQKYLESSYGMIQKIKTNMEAFWIKMFDATPIKILLEFVKGLSAVESKLSDISPLLATVFTAYFGGKALTGGRKAFGALQGNLATTAGVIPKGIQLANAISSFGVNMIYPKEIIDKYKNVRDILKTENVGSGFASVVSEMFTGKRRNNMINGEGGAFYNWFHNKDLGVDDAYIEELIDKEVAIKKGNYVGLKKNTDWGDTVSKFNNEGKTAAAETTKGLINSGVAAESATGAIEGTAGAVEGLSVASKTMLGITVAIVAAFALFKGIQYVVDAPTRKFERANEALTKTENKLTSVHAKIKKLNEIKNGSGLNASEETQLSSYQVESKALKAGKKAQIDALANNATGSFKYSGEISGFEKAVGSKTGQSGYESALNNVGNHLYMVNHGQMTRSKFLSMTSGDIGGLAEVYDKMEKYQAAGGKLTEETQNQKKEIYSLLTAYNKISEQLDTTSGKTNQYKFALRDISKQFNELPDEVAGAKSAASSLASNISSTNNEGDALSSYKQTLSTVLKDSEGTINGTKKFWEAAEGMLGGDYLSTVGYDYDTVRAKMISLNKTTDVSRTSTIAFMRTLTSHSKALKGIGVTAKEVGGKLSFDGINIGNMQKVANILGVSKDYLEAMLDAASRYVNIDWNNPTQTKKDLHTFASSNKLTQFDDNSNNQAQKKNKFVYAQPLKDAVGDDHTWYSKTIKSIYSSGNKLLSLDYKDYNDRLSQIYKNKGYSKWSAEKRQKASYNMMGQNYVAFSKQVSPDHPMTKGFAQKTKHGYEYNFKNVAQDQLANHMSKDSIIEAAKSLISHGGTLVKYNKKGERVKELNSKNTKGMTDKQLTKAIKGIAGFNSKKKNVDIEAKEVYINGKKQKSSSKSGSGSGSSSSSKGSVGGNTHKNQNGFSFHGINTGVSNNTHSTTHGTAYSSAPKTKIKIGSVDPDSLIKGKKSTNVVIGANTAQFDKKKKDVDKKKKDVKAPVFGTFDANPLQFNNKYTKTKKKLSLLDSSSANPSLNIKKGKNTSWFSSFVTKYKSLSGKTVSPTISPKVKKGKGLGAVSSLFGNFANGGESKGGWSLTGEEGAELVRSGNHSYFVGESHPEMAYLHKGDYVYTASETKKITGGKAPSHFMSSRAKGTPSSYHHPSASGTLIVNDNRKTTKKSKSKSKSKSKKKSSKKKSSKKNKFSQIFDWVERRIKWIETYITKWKTYTDSAHMTFTTRSNAALKQMKDITKEIKIQKQAYKYYMKYIDGTLVKVKKHGKTVWTKAKKGDKGAKRVKKRNKHGKVIKKHGKIQYKYIKPKYKRKGGITYTKKVKGKKKKVRLSQHYKNLVKAGKINIQNVKNESLANALEKYEEYYDKAKDAQQKALELENERMDVAASAFDRTEAHFNGLTGILDHRITMASKLNDQLTAKGQFASKQLYENQITLNQRKLAQLNREKAELQSDMMKYYNAGGKIGTEEWYNLNSKITACDESIGDVNSSLIELQNNIRQLGWDKFDKLQEYTTNIADEMEFMITTLSKKDLYNELDSFYDNDIAQGREVDYSKFPERISEYRNIGKLNGSGLATGALHISKYKTYEMQAQKYGEAVAELNKEIAASGTYNKDLTDRRNTMLKSQQEAITSALGEKDAIKTLISDGYQKQLDALSKLIDKRKEALQATKDLYDYQNTMKEKTKTVNSYKKQIIAIKGDNSEEAIAKRQKLNKSLEDAQKDLQDTQYDHWLNDQTTMMDDLNTRLENLVTTQTNDTDAMFVELEKQLSNQGTTVTSAIDKEISAVEKYTPTEETKTIMTNFDSFSANFHQNIKEDIDGVGTSLSSINTNLDSFWKAYQKKFDTTDKDSQSQINGSTDDATNAIKPKTSREYFSSIFSNLGKHKYTSKETKEADKSKHNNSLYYYLIRKGLSSSINTRESLWNALKKYEISGFKDAYVTGSDKSSKSKRAAQDRKILAWMKSNKFSNGGTIGNLIHNTGEDGFILAKSGEEVLSIPKLDLANEMVTNLVKMSASPGAKYSNLGSSNIGGIQFTVENMNLPNVTDSKNFADEFVNVLQNDNRIQKAVRSVSVDLLNGNNSLSVKRF